MNLLYLPTLISLALKYGPQAIALVQTYGPAAEKLFNAIVPVVKQLADSNLPHMANVERILDQIGHPPLSEDDEQVLADRLSSMS